MTTQTPLDRTASLVASPGTSSTVIIGAGIIGLATAFYLSESGNTKPDTIHLVEAAPELFASASGKAAGFMAPDWFGPQDAELGKLSFRLHKELAEKYGGREKWGYSRSTATLFTPGKEERAGMTGQNGASRTDGIAVHDGDGMGPSWLTRRKGDSVKLLSEEGGVAQVDPLRLCRWLIRESLRGGVRLHHPAKPIRISQDDEGKMNGVRLQYGSDGPEHRIPCTRLLLTAGAWTPTVFSTLFPSSNLRIGVESYAGYSVVVKSPRWTKEHESKGCDAVFTSMRSGFSPEILSRVGEEIYVAGLNDPSMPLPEVATDAKIDDAKIAELTKVSQRLLGSDGLDPSDVQVVREGLCFRPVTRKGVPILSRIEERELGGIGMREGTDGGVFVAAGHGPWGISLSLGTGKCVQEMLEGVGLSADVKGLGLQ